MADKNLQSITFPGLTDRYVVPQVDNTLTQAGRPADAKKTGDEISSLKNDFTQLDETAAKIDGSYDTMTVGNAKQLVSTVGIEDNAPYLFRTAGGSNDIGDREEDTIVGGTIAWNQLNALNAVNIPSPSVHPNLSITKNADNSVTISGTSGSAQAYPSLSDISMPVIASHVYLLTTGNYANDGKVCFYWNDSSKVIPVGKTYAFYKNIANPNVANVYVRSNVSANTEVNVTAKVMLFDLTAMFGSTIADYIYNLEQATAGAGVAWFRKLFPKDYYPYSAPTFKHVEGLASHKMVGFNAFNGVWNEGKTINPSNGELITSSANYATTDYIKILPNTSYYGHVVQSSPDSINIAYYDEDKKLLSYHTSVHTHKNRADVTPDRAYYMRITITKAYSSEEGFCIHLHWDGERDGEYEAYKEYTHPLDDSLTLRGIPKLDANNNLYYDGDIYEADGAVARNYHELVLSGTTADGIIVGSITYSSDVLLVRLKPTYDHKRGGNYVTYNAICDKFEQTYYAGTASRGVRAFAIQGNWDAVIFYDPTLTSLEAWNTYLQQNPVTLIYELGTPITETADPFQTPQIVDDWGTEEYVYADGAFPIPVGHNTFYAANLKAKLEMAPDSPGDGDGDYIVRQINGLNEYVKMVKELPSAPTTDGSYHLEVTVASGTPTLTWVADE